MLTYTPKLKTYARSLRMNMTDAESILWRRLRKKQILGVQFYRQKPLLDYIVDFCAVKPKIVIECDGSQHRDPEMIILDKARDKALSRLGFLILRFDNLQIIKETDAVIGVIWESVRRRVR